MKFEEIKKLPVWELLQILQNKTRQNSNLIKENSGIIQAVLKGKIGLQQGRFNIAEVQAKNSELIKENSEYLKLHNQLLNFMKLLQKSEGESCNLAAELNFSTGEKNKVKVEERVLSFDETLTQTIKGEIEFDADHPYFDSDGFKEKLIQHYTEIEAYEMCAALLKT